MIFTTSHLIGIGATLAVITGVGIYAGSKVKSAADFSIGGRKAGSGVIAGTIMGTLVGGASTIGTAQLAFQFGLSAWWFCLGAGIACGVLGIGLLRRLHESSVETIPQYLTRTYGSAAGPISSIFSSIGIFFNIIAQLLAFVAILTSMVFIIRSRIRQRFGRRFFASCRCTFNPNIYSSCGLRPKFAGSS